MSNYKTVCKAYSFYTKYASSEIEEVLSDLIQKYTDDTYEVVSHSIGGDFSMYGYVYIALILKSKS